jgi:hypothetical protein
MLEVCELGVKSEIGGAALEVRRWGSARRNEHGLVVSWDWWRRIN